MVVEEFGCETNQSGGFTSWNVLDILVNVLD
jgi:hypothetical protein